MNYHFPPAPPKPEWSQVIDKRWTLERYQDHWELYDFDRFVGEFETSDAAVAAMEEEPCN